MTIYNWRTTRKGRNNRLYIAKQEAEGVIAKLEARIAELEQQIEEAPPNRGDLDGRD